MGSPVSRRDQVQQSMRAPRAWRGYERTSRPEVGAPTLVRLRPFFERGGAPSWYLFLGRIEGAAPDGRHSDRCQIHFPSLDIRRVSVPWHVIPDTDSRGRYPGYPCTWLQEFQTVLLEKLDVQDVRAGPSEAVMPPGLNPTWNPIRTPPPLPLPPTPPRAASLVASRSQALANAFLHFKVGTARGFLFASAARPGGPQGRPFRLGKQALPLSTHWGSRTPPRPSQLTGSFMPSTVSRTRPGLRGKSAPSRKGKNWMSFWPEAAGTLPLNSVKVSTGRNLSTALNVLQTMPSTSLA